MGPKKSYLKWFWYNQPAKNIECAVDWLQDTEVLKNNQDSFHVFSFLIPFCLFPYSDFPLSLI